MPASDRLVAVAAHGLAGSRTDLPSTSLSDVEWFDLVQGCVAADLVGLLAAAADAGHLPVTAGQAEELAVLAAEHAGLSALVERQAVTLASLLAISGIEHRVVDGPALRLAYAGSVLRPSRAARILVAPEGLDEARSLQGPAPDTGVRHERVAVAATLAGLDRTPRTDLPALLGPGVALDLDGRRVEVLTLEQQLVVSCAELAATPVPTLVALRDVAQLALAPGLDAAAVRRLAEVAGVSDSLTRGLAGAWTWFDLADKTELSVWAVRRAVPVAERHNDRRGPQPAIPPRVGLAQRVLGRRPPTSAPTPSRPTATAPALVADTAPTAGPDGRGRPHRTTRRSR
jgi:hypothetical protein